MELSVITPIPTEHEPLPKSVKNKVNGKWESHEIKYYWPYHDHMNNLLGYVIRYETAEGKQTPPFAYCQDETGKYRWSRKAWWGDKRPLYNLNKLSHSPDAQVIIVEGEKSAEALQCMIESAGSQDKLVAVTWPGGTNAVDKIEFTSLIGRKIACWPDADEPGFNAMVYICNKVNAECKILNINDKPKGWDVADAIIQEHWDFKTIIKFIKANLIDPPQITIDEPEPVPLPVNIQDTIEIDEYPFRCLGYSGNHYYYLPAGTRQVKAISGESHGQGSFLTIAPLSFWERNFPGQKGPQWNQAADTLMRINEQIGVYNPNKLRGRGAWYDDGRSVLHLGNKLLVDNVETPIHKFQSRYIYEAGPELEYIQENPITNSESIKLKTISEMLLWEKNMQGTLLAGWCVIAPICGAFKYRPHIWITGKAGSGKSFIIDHIIAPCLGEFALNTTTPTTAAGIRGALCSDALPIVNDEFEGNDYSGDQRVQGILELARQAFSDTGAKILKGTANGKVNSFQIRSCFLMSSITVNLAQHADETRVSVLSLKEAVSTDEFDSKEHFEKLKKLVAETLTKEWCAGLRARSIKLIPVIRSNAEVFASALADKLGKRRTGDAVGGLIAGAYSLVSSNLVTYDQASEWIDKQDWSEQIIVSTESDELKCLEAIMQAVLKDKTHEKSVIELLIALKENAGFSTESSNAASLSDLLDEDKLLRRHGMRYDKSSGYVWISDSHPGIRKILKDTSWHKSAPRLLKRIPGAVQRPFMRFLGVPTRATGIPWSECFGGI
jgi:putative DNA primase/helicase